MAINREIAQQEMAGSQMNRDAWENHRDAGSWQTYAPKSTDGPPPQPCLNTSAGQLVKSISILRSMASDVRSRLYGPRPDSTDANLSPSPGGLVYEISAAQRLVSETRELLEEILGQL